MVIVVKLLMSLTVTTEEMNWLPRVAVISVVPADIAVIFPKLSTEAISGFLLEKVNDEVIVFSYPVGKVSADTFNFLFSLRNKNKSFSCHYCCLFYYIFL